MKNNLNIKNCLVVIKNDFKFNLKSFLIWLAVVSGITIMYMALFPMVKDMMGSLGSMPPGYEDFVSGSEMLGMSNYTYYFGMIYKILLTIIGAYAMITSASLLHDEEQRGSIDFLFSHNVSRSELIISKLINCFLKIFILQFLVVFISLVIGALLKDDTFNSSAIVKASMFSLVALIEYVCLGFLLAVFTPKKTKSVSLALGGFFLLYILGYVSLLGVESLEFFKYLNPVDMLDPNTVINSTIGIGKETYKYFPMILSIIISIASLTVGTIFYHKKDL